MKISILGSGWLGKPLADHFAKQAHSVALSTRHKAKVDQLKADHIDVHLVDTESLDASILSFLDAETLIINITSKNHQAFSELIEQIKTSPIKHVLFVSSSSVYRSTNVTVTEDSDDEDDSSALLQIEKLFRACPHFSTTIVRLSGLIGYQRHPGNFFKNGKVVQQADAPVNLIHRDDCIGIIDAIIKQGQWNQVFNGCADAHPIKRDYYTATRTSLGLLPPEFAESTALSYKVVSNDKVKAVLNYQFIYPDITNIPFGDDA